MQVVKFEKYRFISINKFLYNISFITLYPSTSKLKFQIKLVTVRNTADQDGYELFALPTITADTSCTSHCSHYFHFYKDLNEQLQGLKPIQNPKQRKYL